MLESTRLEYLAAMGVVGWVPRQHLANAAWRLPPLMPELDEAEPEIGQHPSDALQGAEPASIPRSVPAGAGAEVAVELIRARIAGAGGARQQTAVPAPGAIPAAEPVARAVEVQAEPLESFYLQLWQSGSCALLVEAHEPGLESASPEMNLLRDILKAVQLPAPALLSDFHWPLNRNPQLDRSAPAASSALHIFMQSRLEGRGVSSIGCFGHMPLLLTGPDLPMVEQLPEGEQLLEALPPVWFAPALDRLMGDPRRKLQLWHRLQRVMHRWQGE